MTTHESSYGSYSSGAAAAAATWMMGNSGLSFDTDEPDADYTNPNGAGVGIGIGSAFGSGGSTASGSERPRGSFGGVGRGAGGEDGMDRRKEEGVQWWERGADGAGGKLLAYEIPEHWWANKEAGEIYIYIYICCC